MSSKLVPIEPTQEMIHAGQMAVSGFPRDVLERWQAMLAAAPAVEQKPSLVAWVLYDATADKKFVKTDPADGSLAIFDSEEAAMSAKRAHSGTDYKRCEYYSAPQPTPEVEKLVEALE